LTASTTVQADDPAGGELDGEVGGVELGAVELGGGELGGVPPSAVTVEVNDGLGW
jgi:hypothetical protein